MRTITPASHCYRSHHHEGRFDFWPLGIVLVAIVSTTTACHDDAMRTNPMAPAPPSLAVGSDGEWQVNSLADPGDGVCTNSECTLREAIDVAGSGERITFKQNLTGTIALTVGELVIARAVGIDGPGADIIALSGQNLSRVVRIAVGPGPTISGLTITQGVAPGSSGGGIAIDDGGRLTLIGSMVTGNSAELGGGGIHASGTLTLVGSTVAANTAGVGGGINSYGMLTVSRSTISGNTADQGGGIQIVCDVICSVAISSSTITANTATEDGGGTFFYTTTGTVFNTIIAGNRAYGISTAPTADCYENGMKSLGFNLSGSGTGCALVTTTDFIIAPSQVFSAVLEPVLAANGSPRMTHALVERGYAVDAGYCPGTNGDQRGFPRPYDDPRMPNALDACDIGAFEWQPADTKIKGPKP
jgi:CSLREA domain-containing protein